ncbi:c-type cytochrome [Polymorphobacter multimanifer]|uniref:Competence protein ComEA n=1 Tax=Polymorphobacter multimanifer TaxID=1070431 RepID=A0A841LJF0_9SPHN|nr:cytochrome c [Polymorphobacter multimanifer]MBB6229088.1 competence protein ComEA [Polymorphobacter multimanifer]
MNRVRAVLVSVLAGTSVIAGATALAGAVDLPDGPGKQQVIDSCTRCHGMDVIVAQPRSSDEWAEVVSAMVGQGAVLTDEDFEKVVAYLSANVSPEAASAN